jgi:hypothetical protein
VKEAAEFDVGAHEPTQKLRPGGGVKTLASWFEGSSEPVNIGLVPASPKKENPDPIQNTERSDMMFSASNESIDNLTKRPQSRPTTTTGASRFSFFRKASQIQSPSPSDGDDLSNLDIRDALFPSGPPDEFSPAAFKNLQLNSEGTLRRFQTVHIEQQRNLKSLTTTRTSQADELEACQTRNEHLKFQLVEMAEKAAEQERLIAALRAEIDSAYNRPSHETQASSIRKVSSNSTPQGRGPFRRNRSSNMSTLSAESDESSNMSVFSAADSVDSPGTSIAASPVMKHANLHYTNVRHQSPIGDHAHTVIPLQECQKCHGVRANEAWDVVAMMKAESDGLKHRISELEGANDEALNFLNGLKIH